MEGDLLKLLRQTKEDGGWASLTFTTRGGKLIAKLEVELDPPAPASLGSTPPSPVTAPAPGGGRRRRKGAAAKAKAKARAAQHRATQSPPASGDASAPLDPPRRPPHLLLSPSPWGGCQCLHLATSTWMETPHPHHRTTPGFHAWTTATSLRNIVKTATDAQYSALNTKDAPVILWTVLSSGTIGAPNASSSMKVIRSDMFLFCTHL